MTSKSADKRHITLSFPRDLHNEIKNVIISDEIKGYRNPTEFIVSAVREKVELVKFRSDRYDKGIKTLLKILEDVAKSQ